MGALSGSEVHRGDILICKSFSLKPNGTHFGIRAGQLLFDDIERSNAVHAQIAVSTGEEPIRTIESTGEGVRDAPCLVESDVFRLRRSYPGRDTLADEAAKVAEELRDWTSCRRTSGGEPAGRYNMGRSMFSVVRFQSYGPLAKRLVDEVTGALDGGASYERGFFCSMLVTLCYQVAAKRKKLPAPPIERDAMNMSPSSLQRYLRAHTSVWACIGIYNRPEGGILNRWATRVLQAE